jgi:hypothetical protein
MTEGFLNFGVSLLSAGSNTQSVCPFLAGYVPSRDLPKAATGNASSGYEGQLTGNFVNSRSWPRAVPRDRPLCSAKMRGR